MYYIEKDNEIVLFNSVKKKLKESLLSLPQYAELDIKSTDKDIVVFDGKFYFEDDEDYLTRKAAKEQERIQALYMTRSDFFDGTIKAFGADSKDLLEAIQAVLQNIQVTDLEKKIAINNYENALNFYRKHTLFTILSGVPLTIGEHTIQISAEQWDKFFDETAKRNPDAYRELLPSVNS